MGPLIHPARREAGITFIEMIVVLAIVLILFAAVGMKFNNKSGQANATFTGLEASLDRAETLAQMNSNGATLVAFTHYASDGVTANGIEVYVCAGRPNGNGIGTCAQTGVYPTNTSVTPPGGSAISPPWAIYVDTDGTVAAGAWPTSQSNTLAGTITTVASEPSCAAGSNVLVNIAYSGFSGTPTLPCTGGAMTRTGF